MWFQGFLSIIDRNMIIQKYPLLLLTGRKEPDEMFELLTVRPLVSFWILIMLISHLI